VRRGREGVKICARLEKKGTTMGKLLSVTSRGGMRKKCVLGKRGDERPKQDE